MRGYRPCLSLCEVFVQNFLVQEMFDVRTNVGFEWSKAEICGREVQFKYDFVIECGSRVGDLGIIIEVDGPHHFHDYYPHMSLEEVQKRDVMKMICAWERGYSVIRIDVECLCDDDWGALLLSAIWDILEGDAVGAESRKIERKNVIYIGERYDSHRFTVEEIERVARLTEVRRREMENIDVQRSVAMERALLSWIEGK